MERSMNGAKDEATLNETGQDKGPEASGTGVRISVRFDIRSPSHAGFWQALTTSHDEAD